MKKILCLLAFAGFAAAAAAQPAQAPAAPSAPTAPAAGSLAQVDTMSFCYYEGKPYSEGAVLNNMVCIAPNSVIANRRLPLVWKAK
ncbi:DUF1496 domain-containing protein [Cupriavidus pauculus]|uniref:DUF1496 domain-containing protein n=1 Tax=Cupriavidus pauculus TaxID=82633 RepID=UPI001D0C0E0B|nr:DUF1496 domain-containing protein [Cupriavidus pauculus]